MQSTYQGQRIHVQIGRADTLQIPATGNYTRRFPKYGQETGSLNRFVCLQDKHPIATVLQLKARSCSTGCGCLVNITGKPPSLHASPICNDFSLLDQASQKKEYQW